MKSTFSFYLGMFLLFNLVSFFTIYPIIRIFLNSYIQKMNFRKKIFFRKNNLTTAFNPIHKFIEMTRIYNDKFTIKQDDEDCLCILRETKNKKNNKFSNKTILKEEYVIGLTDLSFSQNNKYTLFTLLHEYGHYKLYLSKFGRIFNHVVLFEELFASIIGFYYLQKNFKKDKLALNYIYYLSCCYLSYLLSFNTYLSLSDLFLNIYCILKSTKNSFKKNF